MYTKEIEYVDYNGVPQKETHYFNMNEAEIAELELRAPGGLEAYVKKLVALGDGDKLTDFYKSIILKAHGEKSLDGRRFIKDDHEMSKIFEESKAFSKLFIELLKDDTQLKAFMSGIVEGNA